MIDKNRDKGKIITVLGAIDSSEIGITLPHEHILMDLSAYFSEPDETTEKKMAYEKVSLNNLHWIHTHLMGNQDDVVLNDEKLAADELLRFKKSGGKTVVELSCVGLGRDPLGLKRIAIETGLNIVMGAGYYVGCSHPENIRKMDAEEIADEIVKDITIGVGQTGVRAGIIGEIGCSHPFEDAERKIVLASAIAQKATGVAINIHPSRHDESLIEIINILERGGANLQRTVISHLGHFGYSAETIEEVAKAGCYLEFDTFGHPALPVDTFKSGEGRLLEMPSEVQRINHIKTLIEKGYAEKILISQDCCFKHKLTNYGGYGYAHILEHIVPWMQERGITDQQIELFLIRNPEKMLRIA